MTAGAIRDADIACSVTDVPEAPVFKGPPTAGPFGEDVALGPGAVTRGGIVHIAKAVPEERIPRAL